jgi:hypothetical protein
MPYKRQKDKKLALKLEIQTYQILTNDDELCIPSISIILLAVFETQLTLMSVSIIPHTPILCQSE